MEKGVRNKSNFMGHCFCIYSLLPVYGCFFSFAHPTVPFSRGFPSFFHCLTFRARERELSLSPEIELSELYSVAPMRYVSAELKLAAPASFFLLFSAVKKKSKPCNVELGGKTFSRFFQFSMKIVKRYSVRELFACVS